MPIRTRDRRFGGIQPGRSLSARSSPRNDRFRSPGAVERSRARPGRGARAEFLPRHRCRPSSWRLPRIGTAWVGRLQVFAVFWLSRFGIAGSLGVARASSGLSSPDTSSSFVGGRIALPPRLLLVVRGQPISPARRRASRDRRSSVTVSTGGCRAIGAASPHAGLVVCWHAGPRGPAAAVFIPRRRTGYRDPDLALRRRLGHRHDGLSSAGATIGGPKLAPRLSPSKTWSGFGVGIVLWSLAGLGSSAPRSDCHRLPVLLAGLRGGRAGPGRAISSNRP